MSVGFLLSGPDDAVIWRGPKKNGTSILKGESKRVLTAIGYKSR